MRDAHSLTRRGSLRAAGGFLAGIGFLDLGGTDAAEIVRANVGYSEPSGLAAVEQTATELVWEFGFDAVTAMLPEDTLDRLARRADVRYVERDPQVETIAVGHGGQTLPWGVDYIDADEAHDSGFTGRDSHVGIIDTGIDLTHSDLASNVGPGVVTMGGVVAPGGQDDNGHGTHCAGIVAAGDNDRGVVGVAPDATVHPVKAVSAVGVGFTSDAARGLEYAAAQGWDVASLSLGGDASGVMSDAVSAANDAGVLVVAAAGNDGGDITHPASHPDVVSVGAINRNGGIPSWSSGQNRVDVLAPGVGVYSTFLRGYASLDGTSMAAPHVAGVAALVGPDPTRTDLAESGNVIDAAGSVGVGSTEGGTGSGGGTAGVDLFGL